MASTENTIQMQKDHVLSDSDLNFTLEVHGEKLEWKVTNAGQATFEGTIRLSLDLPEHFKDPWFMVPGFFYGENRRVDQKKGKSYPRFDASVNEPADMCSNWWEFGADRSASPIIYVHEGERALALASVPHYQSEGEVSSDDIEPQHGIGFKFDGNSGYLRFSVPACEEPFTYSNTIDPKASVRRVCIVPGASVSGTFFLYDLEGSRHSYQSVLESYYARLAADHPSADLPEIKSLVSDAAQGIIAGHYQPEQNYISYSKPYDPVNEQIANAKGVSLEWHQMMIGFVGGFVNTHALLNAHLITGESESLEVCIKVTDKICKEGISPSGLFWADYTPKKIITPNGEFENPLCKDRNEWGSGWLPSTVKVHSRTIADGCSMLASMIEKLEKKDASHPSLPLWRGALESNLKAALDLQMENGSYGQYYDAVEKKVVKEDGCGGLLWIPALLKAVNLGLSDEITSRVKDSVLRAGEAYASYVENEYIWGAPEDNDSPTSEDGMNAVWAYCDLYEAYGDKRHLELATIATDWMLTFRKTYNQILPKNSLMGKYDMRSQGGDFASVSNNHLHVFEVLVTRQLCKLSEWTGKDYYKKRAKDHWAFVCQHLSREDGMFNGFRGAMAEQFYWTNYGSWAKWLPPHNHKQKGNAALFTAVWCIAMIPLAAPDALREFYT